MARFLAEIEGKARKPVHRLGSPSSGIRAQAQGWLSGVTVYGSVDEHDRDVFTVVVTGGSSGLTERRMVAIIRDGIVELDPWQDIARSQLPTSPAKAAS